MADSSLLLGRRRFLRHLVLGGLALGSAACGPAQRGAGGRAGSSLQLWTLDLAPRFSGYMERVLAAWEHQRGGRRPTAVRWKDVPWSSVERKLLASV